MQLEELNMENSRLVNPELERLGGVVDGLKAEVTHTIYHDAKWSPGNIKHLISCRE